MATRTVITMPCPKCGNQTKVELDEDAFQRWRGGELIQNCFPNMPKAERETLMTGFHPACWDKVFGREDEQ